MIRPLRQLIVEDSDADLKLLLSAVRSGGYEPTYEVVYTATAMRAALEHSEWDVITSDHSMPRFSASAALELAKEVCPGVPFIIVSGQIDLGVGISLIKAGARDYIQKSELVRLGPAIDQVLRETQLRRERLTMVQDLKASETRYRRLFETAQDGILILNAATAQIVDANPFVVDMLGYSQEHCVGKKLWEIGAFTDIEACKTGFLELQDKGYVRYEDLPLVTKEGKAIDVEYVSNVYLVEGRKVIQCNIRDITSRVQAEASLRTLNAELEEHVRKRTSQFEVLNHELETFNYAVSHDLCAPLRRTLGFVDALERGYLDKLDHEGQSIIQSIRASAQHMNTLIDGLLRLARFSHDELKPRSTDLSALAHTIATELQQSAPDRRVEFVIGEGIMGNGDDALIRVVLENLLGNAWKFTSKRDSARIEFGVIRQSDGVLVCFVGDNGAGFDMKYADTLFGAFRRFHKQDEFPGTGIGLASVQRIIHRHNGQIWAKSTVGQGTTVYFTLETVSGQGLSFARSVRRCVSQVA
jgi:PAS domain S-box-containing protein